MKVLADYTSKRSGSEGTPESRAELNRLKEAHQKRLLRTFNNGSLERQYVSLSWRPSRRALLRSSGEQASSHRSNPG